MKANWKHLGSVLLNGFALPPGCQIVEIRHWNNETADRKFISEIQIIHLCHIYRHLHLDCVGVLAVLAGHF